MTEKDQPQPTPTHETHDVPFRPFVYFVVVMIVSAILMHLGLAGLSKLYSHFDLKISEMPVPVAQGPDEPPTPPLLLSSKPLENLRRQETEELHKYQWIDRKQGYLGIPIDQAMDVVAQRGIPDWHSETDYRNW